MTRGGVNEPIKFLKGTWLMSQNEPNTALF
jgi:hypothetical protein